MFFCHLLTMWLLAWWDLEKQTVSHIRSWCPEPGHMLAHMKDLLRCLILWKKLSSMNARVSIECLWVSLPFLLRVACSHYVFESVGFLRCSFVICWQMWSAGRMRLGDVNRFSHSQLVSRARAQCLLTWRTSLDVWSVQEVVEHECKS